MRAASRISPAFQALLIFSFYGQAKSTLIRHLLARASRSTVVRRQQDQRATIMTDKTASTDYPIHELLARRWSPYAFAARLIPQADLRSLFEAARWAPSSYNEQPWSYILATRDDPTEFDRLVSCLADGNQVWAKAAPVLALGVVRLKFARDDRENRAAIHDLGLAAASLVLEATARNLYVHQMIGILPEKAREVYRIPQHSEAWTGLAIGYRGDSSQLPDALKARDLAPRQRKSLNQFVFTGSWGNPAPFVK
jgi:nitroreductase